MSEQDPLLASPSDPEIGSSKDAQPFSWKARTAEGLESQRLHQTVIALIIIDSACVLADLGYTLLTNVSCTPAGDRIDMEDPLWLDVLAHISLVITTLFLVEIPLQVWAFGVGYYNPFVASWCDDGGRGEKGRGKVMYGGLHLFDAVVVVTTFVLEVVLKGRERELAGLLVLLRLWRLVKLVGGVAVGAGELSEEGAQELVDARRELEDTRAALASALDKNRILRMRLASVVHDPDDPVA